MRSVSIMLILRCLLPIREGFTSKIGFKALRTVGLKNIDLHPSNIVEILKQSPATPPTPSYRKASQPME